MFITLVKPPINITKALIEDDFTRLRHHLKRLNGEDRHLRFGGYVTDDIIDNYVDKVCKRSSDVVFIMYPLFNPSRVVGSCHFAISDNDSAEIGISIDNDFRGYGYAHNLFARAHNCAQAFGIKKIYVNCLSRNKAIIHIARSNGYKVTNEGFGDSVGVIELKPNIFMGWQELMTNVIDQSKSTARKYFTKLK